jgi:hypothetical protein
MRSVMTRSFRMILKRRLARRRPAPGCGFGYITAVSTFILAFCCSARMSSPRPPSTPAASDAEIVNVSGRQRMLSQRILHAGRPLGVGTAEPENVAARLMASIRLFETAHLTPLLRWTDLPPEAQMVYFGAPGLDRRSRAYIDLRARRARDPAGPARGRQPSRGWRSTGLDALLSTLNDAVTAFEMAANRNSANIA